MSEAGREGVREEGKEEGGRVKEERGRAGMIEEERKEVEREGKGKYVREGDRK